jgi:hypothetical protein
VIPSEQVVAAPPAHVPAMRLSPLSEVVFPPAPAPASPRRGSAVAVVAAVVCGVLGLLVAPVLLGPAAIVGGFAGEHAGTRRIGGIAVLTGTVGVLVAVLVARGA